MKYINQIVYVDNARVCNSAEFCNGHYGIITGTPDTIRWTDFDYCLYFVDQSVHNHGREYWYFMEDEFTGDFQDGIKGN